MSKYTHKLRIGDKVWVEGRQPQPNGYIKRIFWEEKEVLIFFHKNNKNDKQDLMSMDFDELWGCYEPEFLGGIYLIYLQ